MGSPGRFVSTWRSLREGEGEDVMKRSRKYKEFGELTANARKLLLALATLGPVRAIGPVIYDAKMNPLMNNSRMCDAVQELGVEGVLVRRTDSGGSPTWDIEIDTRRKRPRSMGNPVDRERLRLIKQLESSVLSRLTPTLEK